VGTRDADRCCAALRHDIVHIVFDLSMAGVEASPRPAHVESALLCLMTVRIIIAFWTFCPARTGGRAGSGTASARAARSVRWRGGTRPAPRSAGYW
jgi:hypothetical protein